MKENKLIQRGRYFDTIYEIEDFEPEFDKYDFVKMFTSKYIDCTYGLKSDETLWVTGNNQVVGKYSPRNNNISCRVDTFTKIDGVSNIKDIAIGSEHTVILKKDGTLLGVGQNSNGALGLGGDITVATTFTKLPIEDVVKVVVGSGLTIALKSNGELYFTGYNGSQQFDNLENTNTFIKLSITDVKDIDCGDGFTFILKTNGELYSCGSNSYGQLGLGDNTNRNTFTKVNIDNVKEISCGRYNSFIIKNDDSLYGCGYNTEGQLGLGDITNRNVFTNMALNVKKVVYGINSTIILKNDDSLYGCGRNTYGQLGLRNVPNPKTFIKIGINNIKDIYCGNNHTIMIRNDNKLLFCGTNRESQIGNPNNINYPVDVFTEYKSAEVLGYNKSVTMNNKNYLIKENGDYICYGNIKKIVSVEGSTYALLENGELWVSGNNTDGQLGLNHKVTQNYFTRVPIDNIRDVVCGAYYAFIIKNDDTVWVTGLNNSGQLGTGNTSQLQKFTKISIDNVKKIACGRSHVLILKNDNSIWGAGAGYYLGIGTTSSTGITSFTKVPIDDVRDIACGYECSIILKNDNSIWGAGANHSGQLGKTSNNSVEKYFIELSINKAVKVKEIYCGIYHTLILKTNGELYGCGSNTQGQLGRRISTDKLEQFTLIETDTTHICNNHCESYNTLIIDSIGRLKATGQNNYNQLGLENNKTTPIESFTPTNIVIGQGNNRYIAGGSDCTFLVKTDGKVYGIGNRLNGRFGTGSDSVAASTFTRIGFEFNSTEIDYNNDFRIATTNVNDYMSVFLKKSNGELYGVGNNTYGQLGIGNNSTCHYFYPINIKNIKDVICGLNYTLILKKDGELLVTGNTSSQKALDTKTLLTSEPYRFNQVSTISNVEKVVCGSLIVFALLGDGRLYSTGTNTYGQLGLGDIANRDSFARVNINNVKEIACGISHTLILTSNGELYATGRNDEGQLGLGDNTNRNTFTKVNINNVRKVICGAYYTLVLTNDGELYATGRNKEGQLGLGDIVNRDTFTKVNIDNVKEISCGLDHTLVLKNNGELYGCGSNGQGQLGLGDNTGRNTFTKINIDNVKGINAGGRSSYIYKNDGSVFSTGQNTYGLLGLGDVTNRNIFTKVNIKIFDFEKITDCIVNNNFNLVNNKFLIPTKDTKYQHYVTSSDDFNYNEILGSQYPVSPYANEVLELPFNNIKEFWMSKTHSLIVNTDGELYGCGKNTYGQLLNPLTTTSLLEFTKLNFDNIKQASCGNGFSYFVRNDGALFSCGLNSNGQLGLGHNNDVSEPQLITTISNVKKVMCDNNFTLALLNNNELYAQGYNRFGNFGLGEEKKDTIIPLFTKIATNVEDVEIGTNYILLRKTDNTVYISGRIRDCYNIEENNIYVFNEIKTPSSIYKENLVWVNPVNDETVSLIYKVNSVNSTIEIIEKTISGIKLKINDDGNEIIKIEMYINNELITTMTEFTNKYSQFTIPLDKLVLGRNNIVFKGYDNFKGNIYTSLTINKENNSIYVSENSSLLINGKRYTVQSVSESEGKVTVNLDRGLEGNVNVGDIIYQLINRLNVQIKTNNTGMHKDAKLLEMKKVDTGYQEIYEFKENGIKEVEPKIIVNGNEDTAIKRPSMIFSIDETTL
ncbi:RCC1 domain-containing protein, alpha-tubulin suppressor (plasmid) [Clostridioides difficile]|uniref:RCC1 domain-containing protein n=1 Tax=Clostridioides difficile TaxID=1496 RepID=UPI003BA2312F